MFVLFELATIYFVNFIHYAQIIQNITCKNNTWKYWQYVDPE